MSEPSKHNEVVANVEVHNEIPITKARQKRGNEEIKEITQRASKRSKDPNSKHKLVDEAIVIDKEVTPPMWHHIVTDSKTGELVHEECKTLKDKNAESLKKSVK